MGVAGSLASRASGPAHLAVASGRCRSFAGLASGVVRHEGPLSTAADQQRRSGASAGAELTWLARTCPSWQEHAGVAVLLVGLLNGALVVTGFAITWLSTLKRHELDCRTQRLQRELQRTESQLEYLFGPLRAITHATEAGYRSFKVEHELVLAARSQHARAARRADLEVWIHERPHGQEGRRYRQLIACTLQPLNRRAMETVLSHTHFIDGEFPECLYSLYAHVIEIDSLMQRWDHGDFSVMFPPTRYPVEVAGWAGQEFERLRAKQKDLLGQLEGKC